MSVSKDEVLRIAELARLELGEVESEALRGDLNGILSHMDRLGEVQMPPPEPGVQPHRDGPAPVREDGREEPDRPRRGLDELAPAWKDGFFTVPRLPGLEDS